MAHQGSIRANSVDARSVYVAITRARQRATIYTDNRANLTEALGILDRAQVGGIDDIMSQQTPSPLLLD